MSKLPLPVQHHLRRDVTHALGPQMWPHIVVGQVPVVEAGLGRETTVSVESVEIQVKQLVDRRSSRNGLELATIDLGNQLAPGHASLGRGPKAPPGELF